MRQSVQMSRDEVFDLVREDLQLVEQAFGTDTICSVEAVTSIGHYLRLSGGKRIRPALLLLAAKLCGYSGPPAIQLGAVVEIIHTATLVHDDVIDGADKRRGRPSTNSRWGNHRSVLAGDWLYMQAFQMALRQRNFHILDILIHLTQMMIEGELLQLEYVGRGDITEEQQLDLVHRKTACLFAGSAQLGAVIAGQPAAVESELCEYGRNMGMAFQLVDDLLDFTAHESTLGKPVGSDLREGKVTLPLIYALRLCAEEERALVLRVLEERASTSVSAAQILTILERYRTPAAVMEKAGAYAREALVHLAHFPDSPFRRALEALPEFVLHRDS
jgi:octaprenyl-diphosphate synthase